MRVLWFETIRAVSVAFLCCSVTSDSTGKARKDSLDIKSDKKRVSEASSSPSTATDGLSSSVETTDDSDVNTLKPSCVLLCGSRLGSECRQDKKTYMLSKRQREIQWVTMRPVKTSVFYTCRSLIIPSLNTRSENKYGSNASSSPSIATDGLSPSVETADDSEANIVRDLSVNAREIRRP